MSLMLVNILKRSISTSGLRSVLTKQARHILGKSFAFILKSESILEILSLFKIIFAFLLFIQFRIKKVMCVC